MTKYVVWVYEDGKVHVLRHYGQEAGIQVYEHYKTMDSFPAAVDLIRRLERDDEWAIPRRQREVQ